MLPVVVRRVLGCILQTCCGAALLRTKASEEKPSTAALIKTFIVEEKPSTTGSDQDGDLLCMPGIERSWLQPWRAEDDDLMAFVYENIKKHQRNPQGDGVEFAYENIEISNKIHFVL